MRTLVGKSNAERRAEVNDEVVRRGRDGEWWNDTMVICGMYMGGMAASTIAKELNIGETTVRRRIHEIKPSRSKYYDKAESKILQLIKERTLSFLIPKLDDLTGPELANIYVKLFNPKRLLDGESTVITSKEELSKEKEELVRKRDCIREKINKLRVCKPQKVSQA